MEKETINMTRENRSPMESEWESDTGKTYSYYGGLEGPYRYTGRGRLSLVRSGDPEH